MKVPRSYTNLLWILIVVNILMWVCITIIHVGLPVYLCNFEDDQAPPYEGNNMPKTKNLRIRVFHHTGNKWEIRNDICDVTGIFPSFMLHTPVGNKTIFTYPQKDAYFSRVIYSKGIYEGPLVKKVIDILKENKDMNFIDVGALAGQYMLIAAMLNRKVAAIDPLLRSIKCMCKTISEHNYQDNIILVHNALSDENGIKSLKFKEGNFGETEVVPIDSSPEYNFLDRMCIETTKLDDLLTLVKHFGKVMVKIDVESSEANVIKGAEEFFKVLDVRFVVMEWLHIKENEMSVETIFEFMNRHSMLPYSGDRSTTSSLQFNDYMDWDMNIIWKKKV